MIRIETMHYWALIVFSFARWLRTVAITFATVSLTGLLSRGLPIVEIAEWRRRSLCDRYGRGSNLDGYCFNKNELHDAKVPRYGTKLA